MPSKEALMIYARSVAAYYPTMSVELRADYLEDMYNTAMQVPPHWTLDNGKGTNHDALKQLRWLRKDGVPGGTNTESEGIAWCGIFATYCLRCIGIPALWKQFKGISVDDGSLRLLAGYTNSDQIERGDICVVKTNQHHFIVGDRNGDTLFSYDGNLPGQMIGERRYDIAVLREGVKKQADYDKSDEGKANPQSSKYSFYFYKMQY